MPGYTRTNLEDVEDQAAKHGFGPAMQARFPYRELGLDGIALSHQRLAPGERQPFAHRHEAAEEVYVVLSGSGLLLVDGEVVEVRPLDAIRVAPPSVRSFAAGPDGIEYLAFGTRHEGDAQPLPAEWP